MNAVTCKYSRNSPFLLNLSLAILHISLSFLQSRMLSIGALFLLFFGMGANLQGEQIAFRDLRDQRTGNVVSIRGFLYEGKGGEAILADEPNLRTCCVGSSGKKEHQVIIPKGVNLGRHLAAVTLEGKLQIDRSDHASFKYRLEDAVPVIENPTEELWPWAAILLGAFITLFLSRKRLAARAERFR